MHSLLAMRDAEFTERRIAQARAAITPVLEAIDTHIAASRYDATICNGLAGLGEVLLAAGVALGDRAYLDRARDLAQVLIDRYSEHDNWPTGFPDAGPNPSLFLGTAGIGYWLLRLDEPERIPCWILLDATDGDCLSSAAGSVLGSLFGQRVVFVSLPSVVLLSARLRDENRVPHRTQLNLHSSDQARAE